MFRLFPLAAASLVVAACDPAPTGPGRLASPPASPAAVQAPQAPSPGAPARPASSSSPAEAHIVQSLKHWRQGEYIAAVQALRKATEADASNAAAHLSLGQALLLRSPERDAIAAEAEFRKTLELGYGVNPPDASANKLLPHLWLGRALLEQSRFEEAKAELEAYLNQAASKEDIAAADALLRLGIVEAQSGQADAAQQALRQAVTLSDAARSSPRMSDPIYQQHVGEIQTEAKLQLGSVLAQQDAPAEAEKLFQAVVALQPDNENVHFRLMKLYQKLGRNEDAAREQEIQELFNQIRDSATVRARRDVDEQKRVYNRLKEIFPAYWRAYTRLARIYLQNQLPDQAIEEAERLLQAAPDSPETSLVRGEAHFVRGQAFLAKQDRSRALTSFEQAATLAPAFREKLEEIKMQLQQKPLSNPN